MTPCTVTGHRGSDGIECRRGKQNGRGLTGDVAVYNLNRRQLAAYTYELDGVLPLCVMRDRDLPV